MLTFTPFISMMVITLIMSTIMTATAPNWLTAWIMLEINMLAFIPMILQSKSNQETEAAIKYFLSQALGSMLLLLGSSLLMSMMMNKTVASLILLSSLLLKLGAAPCHLWFPSVMASLSWTNCFILSTWQKIAPMILLSFSLIAGPMQKLMACVALAGTTIGGIMGLNQSSMRTILAYSSISHLGWMIILANNPSICMSYLILYFITVTPIFILMMSSNMKTITQINMSQKTKFSYLILLLMMCSIAGIPPLTGFLPKLMAIITLMSSQYMIILLMLMGSFMNLYFYLNVAFSVNMQPTPTNTNKLLNKTPATPIILSTCMLGILPMLT